MTSVSLAQMTSCLYCHCWKFAQVTADVAVSLPFAFICPIGQADIVLLASTGPFSPWKEERHAKILITNGGFSLFSGRDFPDFSSIVSWKCIVMILYNNYIA